MCSVKLSLLEPSVHRWKKLNDIPTDKFILNHKRANLLEDSILLLSVPLHIYSKIQKTHDIYRLDLKYKVVDKTGGTFDSCSYFFFILLNSDNWENFCGKLSNRKKRKEKKTPQCLSSWPLSYSPGRFYFLFYIFIEQFKSGKLTYKRKEKKAINKNK